jgi:pyruvate dehydrogenase E2 component (dihydrolipoamide acetyltransferase)
MDVLMPQLGETVAEGKIVKWFKAAGDAVKPGDNLFEIETDKTSMEVPATCAGMLREIRFGVGEVAKVGAVVAVIAGAGEVGATNALVQSKQSAAALSAPQPPRMSAQAEIPSPASFGPRLRGDERQAKTSFAYPNMDPFREVRTPERNFGPARTAGGASITPLARRLASERNIDLSRINGSGPQGRVVAADIEKAAPYAADRVLAIGVSAAQVKALYEGVAYEEVPLDSMRRTLAAQLVEAKQTIPHFYLTADIEIDRLITLCEEANAAAPFPLPSPLPRTSEENESARTLKLSLNDFIIKAWALALQRTAAANAVWAEDRILRFVHSDVGVAVALESGLVTPLVRCAESKSLTAISAEMRDLAARARDKKLKPHEYQGGVSAISNLGLYGVREFSAIITPPHATLLAVGAPRRAPVETEGGGVKFISQMTVTLCCDQRVVDGALGAQLLATFTDLLERPVSALV